MAQALKSAGAAQLWLAGRPGEAEQSLKAAGIDGFVYAGCDVLDCLGIAQAVFGT